MVNIKKEHLFFSIIVFLFLLIVSVFTVHRNTVLEAESYELKQELSIKHFEVRMLQQHLEQERQKKDSR